jgi:membrane-associated phospholipid phosphatase
MKQKKLIKKGNRLLIFLVLLGSLTTCYGQSSDFPYKLSYATDIPLVTGALSATIADYYIEKKTEINYLPFDEVKKLNANDIPQFDRSVTKNWSPELDDPSDITRGIVNASPVIIIFPQLNEEKWKNIIVLTVMYLEGNVLNDNITDITKYLTERKRPYLYNTTSITEQEKFWLCQPGGDYAYTSFFSGHTSSTFYSAVFLSKVVSDIYGKSVFTYVVWGTTLFGAATTGYLRYKSGWHYPSDVLAGALVGSVIGYLVPALHKKEKSDNISLSLNGNQIGIKYIF